MSSPGGTYDPGFGVRAYDVHGFLGLRGNGAWGSEVLV